MEVFDYTTIPKFMQEHGRFCLWKLVIKPGKTKPDKIPYRIDGKRADIGTVDILADNRVGGYPLVE